MPPGDAFRPRCRGPDDPCRGNHLRVVMVSSAPGHPGDTVIGFKVIALSLVAFAWRRNRALKQMALRGEIGLTSGQMASLFVGPMGRAIGRRIAGEKRDPAGGVSTGEMAAERVDLLESRVQEMEERFDFAERVLLKSGEPESVADLTPR